MTENIWEAIPTPPPDPVIRRRTGAGTWQRWHQDRWVADAGPVRLAAIVKPCPADHDLRERFRDQLNRLGCRVCIRQQKASHQRRARARHA